MRKRSKRIWFKYRACFKSGYSQWFYTWFFSGQPLKAYHDEINANFEGDPEGIRPTQIVRIKHPPKSWFVNEIEDLNARADDLFCRAEDLDDEMRRLFKMPKYNS